MDIVVTDIEWDTDGQCVRGLPDKVVIKDVDDEDVIAEARDDGYCDYVADWLSDKYGWCVKGFSVEVA